MAKLLTQVEYAKRKRVSPQYINKLVKQGKIELIGRKLDPKQADAAIALFARPGRLTPAKKAARKQAARAAGRKSAAKRKASPRSSSAKSTRPAPAPHRTTATGSLTAARARREEAMARVAELDLQEREKKLLPADEVKEAQRRTFANIRTRMRRVPRAVAAMVARMTVPAEIERFILDQVDAQLAQLADDPLGLKPEEPVAVQTSAEVLPAEPAEAQTNEEVNSNEEMDLARNSAITAQWAAQESTAVGDAGGA